MGVCYVFCLHQIMFYHMHRYISSGVRFSKIIFHIRETQYILNVKKVRTYQLRISFKIFFIINIIYTRVSQIRIIMQRFTCYGFLGLQYCMLKIVKMYIFHQSSMPLICKTQHILLSIYSISDRCKPSCLESNSQYELVQVKKVKQFNV